MCIRDRDTGVWVDPGRDGWKIFEDGTGNTLPMPCREDDEEEDDDDDEINVVWSRKKKSC